jgi:hypothetical protein
MSLVNEALRKARMEATRRDARERGLPQPPPSFLVPRRHRPLWPWVALGGVALLTLAGIGFWVGRWMARPSAEVTAAVPAEIVATVPESPLPAAPTAPPPSGALGPEPALPEPLRSPNAEPAFPPAAASPPTEAPRPRTESAAVGIQRTAKGLPVYVEVAELPDGRLELGGIAWSRTEPHALINGRIVGRGERIEVYTVVEIHPREVELEGTRGSFLLRLN